MLILFVHKKIIFSKLQKLLDLTSGNLTHHLNKLIETGLVITKKMLFSARPMNVIQITEKGKKCFADYLTRFKDILDDIEV